MYMKTTGVEGQATGLHTKIRSNDYGFLTWYTVSELYPSCVNIVDIWPLPNSVLKPFNDSGLFAVYLIKVTFSRSVRVLSHERSRIFFSLSVSTSKPLKFRPYYYRHTVSSERTFWLYFRVPTYMQYVQ